MVGRLRCVYRWFGYTAFDCVTRLFVDSTLHVRLDYTVTFTHDTFPAFYTLHFAILRVPTQFTAPVCVADLSGLPRVGLHRTRTHTLVVAAVG